MKIKELTIGLFNQKSDRDKQHKVGASNISDPCTRHLAHALVGTPQPEQKYYLGGKIGTAIHSFIESAIANSDDSLFTDALIESKITLGEIDGYGIVSSKPDLILPSVRHLIDWKTSSRPKVKKLQNFVDGIKHDSASEYTLQKYTGQMQLYAWGSNSAGVPIDKTTLVFINRDGTSDNDFWTFTVDYDESFAVALWNRVSNLWAELENGAHPESYAPHTECYKCSVGI
jgi:hypothetical protein